MRATIATTLLAAALALGGCESSDDGGDDPDGGMPPDMPGGPDTGAPTASGDVFAIAARADGDDPAALDRAALQRQLDGLLGDADTPDPLSVEDGDTALTTLQRRRDTGR